MSTRRRRFLTMGACITSAAALFAIGGVWSSVVLCGFWGITVYCWYEADGRPCLLGIRHKGAHAWESNEVEALRNERAELRSLLVEAVRQDYGTPGWRARAIKAGALLDDDFEEDKCDRTAPWCGYPYRIWRCPACGNLSGQE